jgi:hypothetical protein
MKKHMSSLITMSLGVAAIYCGYSAIGHIKAAHADNGACSCFNSYGWCDYEQTIACEAGGCVPQQIIENGVTRTDDGVCTS